MNVRALLIAVAIAAVPSTAAGDRDTIPQKARALAEGGRAAHEHGDYPRAIAAFKEAYVIAPAPELLFNLAQAYRLHGNCEDAGLMYRRYLGTDPASERRSLAESHLATVERCVQKRSLNIPLDDSMAYLRIPEPPPDLGVIDSPPPRRAAPGRREQNLGVGFAIGGAGAIMIATYYGFRARSAAQEVERAYAMGAKWKDVARIDARGESAATTAKVFGIGGALAVATGVTLFVVGKRTERAVPISIVPTTTGARVSVTWRF